MPRLMDSTSEIDGVPRVVWFVLLGIAIALTVFTAIRTRKYEALGNDRKARQSKSHIYYGAFLCLLIAARIAVHN